MVLRRHLGMNSGLKRSEMPSKAISHDFHIKWPSINAFSIVVLWNHLRPSEVLSEAITLMAHSESFDVLSGAIDLMAIESFEPWNL
jgi:hypothetical protein